MGIQENRFSFEWGGETRGLDSDQFICWGWPLSNARDQQLLLKTGDLIIGEVQRMNSESIEFSTELFGNVTVSRAAVAGIVIQPPADIVDRDRLLRRIAESPRDEDRVALTNGDEVDGKVNCEGRPAAVFQIGPMKTPIEVKNVVAVMCTLRASTPSDAKTTCWIGLRDGSRLATQSIRPANSKVEMTLQGGIVLTLERDDFRSGVVWMQPPARQFVYLSQQPAVGYKHVPFLATNWELGVDRNALGGNLRSAGHEYQRGLGMHSASRVAYDLGRRYRWLEADIAIDDAAQGRGAVTFRVFVDRTTSRDQTAQWEAVFESSVVRGNEKPIPIRVDIKNAVRIALVVDFSERGDECDYADWLNARLIP